MTEQCCIGGCNKPIVVKEKCDEYLQCCEEHIEEVRQYYENRYAEEQQELYDWWISNQ